MYTIDIILRGNPVAVSVQRKAEAEALALYGEVLAALGSSPARALELTCDKVKDKRVAVLSSDITAVQLVPAKATGAPIGMRAGFFAGNSDSDDE